MSWIETGYILFGNKRVTGLILQQSILMEQCEMMSTSALTIAEAHHFNAVQYLFEHLKLLNQLNVTYFNIQ